jgi:hypothetical protein
MGFTMGTPLNYMMLDNTKKEESNSALATLSLIRSIGTAIAPAIMIGFIAHAGVGIQPKIMALLPTEISVPSLPYAQELTDEFTRLQTDPATKDQFAGISIPDLASMQTVAVDMGSGGAFTMPAEMITLMQTSDVTTIAQNTRTLADTMFTEMIPKITEKITSGIEVGITGIEKGILTLEGQIAAMQKIPDSTGATAGAIAGMNAAKAQMEDIIIKMTALNEAVPNAFDVAKSDYLKKIDGKKDVMEQTYQDTLNGGFRQVYLTVLIAALLALVILQFYRDGKKQNIKKGESEM